MPGFKPTVAVVGHSFVRNLKNDLMDIEIQDLKSDFDLIECSVKLFGVEGMQL